MARNNINTYKQPMYKVEVKAYLCSIEIFVNEIPCFSYFDEPQIATDIPINSLIFSSGVQKLRFKIAPLFNEKKLNKETKIEINVFIKEAKDFYLKKNIIKSFINKESLEGLYWFENELEFDAVIPYNLDTSCINYSFENENIDKLFSEVYTQYEILTGFINKDDLKSYNDFTKIRFNDFVKSHYLDESKQNYYLNKALYSFKGYTLTLIPKTEYILKFCFDNQLVYLQKPQNQSGLILEDLSSGEEQLHFTESAIFYRNNQGNLILYR